MSFYHCMYLNFVRFQFSNIRVEINLSFADLFQHGRNCVWKTFIFLDRPSTSQQGALECNVQRLSGTSKQIRHPRTRFDVLLIQL